MAGFASGRCLYAYVGNNPINANDPSGKFVNFAAGAIVGAGIEVLGQYADAYAKGSDFSYRDIDVGKVIIAGAAGGLTSGASALAARGAMTLASGGAAKLVANYGTQAVIGGIGSGAQTATQNYFYNENKSALESMAWGAGGAIAGAKIGGILETRSLNSQMAIFNTRKQENSWEAIYKLNVSDVRPTSAAMTTGAFLGNAVGGTPRFNDSVAPLFPSQSAGGSLRKVYACP